MKELLALKREKKEKVRDFNQSFTTHLNNFSATIKLAEETMIELAYKPKYHDVAFPLRL